MFNDMEIQIHHLEQEAYCAVLRAFKAQADAITWEKESLITELRKELRVSDDEHRELLSRVNADDVIKRIREWRQGVGHQAGMLNPSQAMSNARRKHKTLTSVPPLSLGMQQAPLHFHPMNASLPPLSLDQGSTPGRRRKRQKSDFPSGPAGHINHSLAANIHTETAASNPLIGRRVMTRWPDDNNFYEAVIIDYDPIQGRHALVYDKDTPKETSEWVALEEIPPADIRWVGEDPSEIHAGGDGPQAQADGRDVGLQGQAYGRDPVTGRLPSRFLNNDHLFASDKIPEEIEVFNTEELVREVERVFSSSNADPSEKEIARQMLLEQEQALVDALAIIDRVEAEMPDEEEPQPAPAPAPGQQ
uniref:ENT domain-containing protein n=1 Tax=Kalanchoe fedtschenkoi TaxID=63787 RepID=A0A7N0VC00_KALFE